MSEDIVKESIKCLANMEIKETTYQVARSVVLDEIERLHSIIKEVREYIEENTNSDSFTTLTSGKITDIPYCIVAFEDILEILDKGE